MATKRRRPRTPEQMADLLTPAGLRAWRERHGLTQEDLAARLSVPGRRVTGINVSRWERGVHEPAPFLALALERIEDGLAGGAK